jgi:hypothetical protein
MRVGRLPLRFLARLVWTRLQLSVWVRGVSRCLGHPLPAPCFEQKRERAPASVLLRCHCLTSSEQALIRSRHESPRVSSLTFWVQSSWSLQFSCFSAPSLSLWLHSTGSLFLIASPSAYQTNRFVYTLIDYHSLLPLRLSQRLKAPRTAFPGMNYPRPSNGA